MFITVLLLILFGSWVAYLILTDPPGHVKLSKEKYDELYYQLMLQKARKREKRRTDKTT